MRNLNTRLEALEERMSPEVVHQIKIIDRNAASWTQEEDDRLCAEAAQYPKDGQIHLVIVEKVDMEQSYEC